mmetsp:Transcript_16903/g.25067  ORF Transcript_16903/g.25067 Transcript_16903/m.25067 type:complete len:612 (-) Transcript_16903:118-1953(-)
MTKETALSGRVGKMALGMVVTGTTASARLEAAKLSPSTSRKTSIFCSVGGSNRSTTSETGGSVCSSACIYVSISTLRRGRKKTMVVNTVCEAILEAGGRFLKFDTRSKTYQVVNKKTARSKVGHALRDAVGSRVKTATASTGGGSNSSSGERRQDFLASFGALGAPPVTRSSDRDGAQPHGASGATREAPQRPTLILPRTEEARYISSCNDMMLGSVPRRDTKLVTGMASRTTLNYPAKGQAASQHKLVQSLGLKPSNNIRNPVPIAPRILSGAPKSKGMPSNITAGGKSRPPPHSVPNARTLSASVVDQSSTATGGKGTSRGLLRRVVGSGGRSTSSSKKRDRAAPRSSKIVDGADNCSETRLVSSCPKDGDSIDSRVFDDLDDAMSFSHGSSSGQSLRTSSVTGKPPSVSEGGPLTGLMGASNSYLQTRMDRDEPQGSVGSNDSGCPEKPKSCAGGGAKSVDQRQSLMEGPDESADLSEEFSVMSMEMKSGGVFDSRSGHNGPTVARSAAVASSSHSTYDVKTAASTSSALKSDTSPDTISSERVSLFRQQQNAQADQDIMDLFRDDVVEALPVEDTYKALYQLDLSGGSSESRFGLGSAAGEVSLTGL